MSRGGHPRVVYLGNVRLPTEKAHGYQISRMCEALADVGAEVTLLHPRRRQSDQDLARTDVFDYYGVRRVFRVRSLANLDVVPLSVRVPGWMFRPIFFIHALAWGLYAALVARRLGADVYYTRERELAIWLAVLGMRTVYEAHVVPAGPGRAVIRALARSGSLTLVVAMTSHILERLVSLGVPRSKSVVEPDAVDLALFRELPPVGECRRRVGLEGDGPIVGYVGRFNTLGLEKGIPELIRAMAGLPDGVRLLCVGGPMDVVPAYRELALQHGIVPERLMFRDRVAPTEVPLWIGACDVVTIPWPRTEFSAFFTSPMKLFEYMAAGRPIVASDLPALRDVLVPERNSLLVEPGDPVSLAAAIGRLLADRALAGQLRDAALQDVRRHTWRGRAESILGRAIPCR